MANGLWSLWSKEAEEERQEEKEVNFKGQIKNMLISALPFLFLGWGQTIANISMAENDILEDKLIEILESLTDLEHTTSFCFQYISSLSKNGRIKARFHSFSEHAKINKEILAEHLKKAGDSNFVLEEKCKFCKLKPESFSLIGALDLGNEVTNASIKSYNNLLHLIQSQEERKLYNQLLKEKTEQLKFIKKEKNFVREHRNNADFITTYCIPEVISKLWSR